MRLKPSTGRPSSLDYTPSTTYAHPIPLSSTLSNNSLALEPFFITEMVETAGSPVCFDSPAEEAACVAFVSSGFSRKNGSALPPLCVV